MGDPRVSGASPTTRRELRARERGARPAPRARRVIGRQVLSVAAMAFILLLTVGVSIPASAVGTMAPTATSAGGQAGASQHATVAADASGVSDSRDGFSVTQQVIARIATGGRSGGAGSGGAGSGTAEPSVPGVLLIAAPGPVLWPTDVSPQIGRGVSTAHHGQDLLMAGGTPVHAVADGTVLASTVEGSLGQFVVVRSDLAGHTVISLYGHLTIGSQAVAAGDHVTQGQTVGLVGSSGAATADLLYLRILQDGALCDTITFIAGDPAGGAAPHH